MAVRVAISMFTNIISFTFKFVSFLNLLSTFVRMHSMTNLISGLTVIFIDCVENAFKICVISSC